MRRYATIADAAAYAGVSRDWLRRLLRRGRVRGSADLVDIESLNTYLQNTQRGRPRAEAVPIPYNRVFKGR